MSGNGDAFGGGSQRNEILERHYTAACPSHRAGRRSGDWLRAGLCAARFRSILRRDEAREAEGAGWRGLDLGFKAGRREFLPAEDRRHDA